MKLEEKNSILKRLDDIEKSLVANNIGLNNVYEQFKSLPGTLNFTRIKKNIDKSEKLLNELEKRQSNLDRNAFSVLEDIRNSIDSILPNLRGKNES